MIEYNDIAGLSIKRLGYKLLDPQILKDPLDVQMILSLKPEIPVDDLENTPLIRAASLGLLETCKLLVEYGVELNSSDHNGWTALHWATWMGYLEVCEFLLDRGAEVNLVENIHGRTALYLAANSGDLEVCKLLVDAGAELNHQNHGGDTALHIAASMGHLEIVRLLVNAGADITIKNIWGTTAWHLATKEIKERVPELKP